MKHGKSENIHPSFRVLRNIGLVMAGIGVVISVVSQITNVDAIGQEKEGGIDGGPSQ